MSRKFSFTVSYAVPVAELHRAIINDKMWAARFAGSDTATVELSHPQGPDTIRIRMAETAAAERIPAMVRKVLKSDLAFERLDDWGPLTNGTATGAFMANTSGIVAEMSGKFIMRPTAAGSEIEYTGEVEVRVPLVGGAIEPLAEQLLHRVTTGEKKFIEEWLAKTTA